MKISARTLLSIGKKNIERKKTLIVREERRTLYKVGAYFFKFVFSCFYSEFNSLGINSVKNEFSKCFE